MSKYTVEITGINTNNLKTLSNEEMNSLFVKYHNGDKLAKEQLINGNLKLILSILKKYNNQKYNLDDLFQVGVIGLSKAVINFDLSFGCLFSTYAVPLITGEIKRYIRDNSTLRISRSIKDNAYKIIKFKEEYINKYGSEPSCDTISNSLNISSYDIYNSLSSLNEPTSIFEPVYSDSGDTIYLYDLLKDHNDKDTNKDNLIALKKGLEKIKKRERDVLENRYIIGKNQTEIANELNISQAQVSRIEKSAIKKLNKYMNR